MRKQAHSAGYSLIEILVVVGIVGIISAFAVPAFVQFQRSLKIKSSLRQFTTDVRSARQAAVTRHAPTKITFNVDPASERRSYEVLIWDDANDEWDPFPQPDTPPRQLADTVYFHADGSNLTFPNTTFPDGVAEGDTRPDIVFQENGTVRMDEITAAPAAAQPLVWLRANDDIPFNQIRIQLQTTGNIQTTQNKWN